MEWIRGYRIDNNELSEESTRWALRDFDSVLPRQAPGMVIFRPNGRFYFYGPYNYKFDSRAEYRYWCITHHERMGRGMMIGKGFYEARPISCVLWNLEKKEDIPHLEKMLTTYPFARPYYPAENHFQAPILVDGRMCLYLYDYYPSKRFPYDELAAEDQKVSNFIYRFKEGEKEAVELAARLVMLALMQFERIAHRINDMTLMVIPAATRQRNEARYRWFCYFLAERQKLRFFNGIDWITIESDREELKGQHGDKTSNLRFNADCISGRDILLFDDILTSGEGFSQIARKLEELGAKSVLGVFLAKTVSDMYAFEVAPPIKPFGKLPALKVHPPKKKP